MYKGGKRDVIFMELDLLEADELPVEVSVIDIINVQQETLEFLKHKVEDIEYKKIKEGNMRDKAGNIFDIEY